MFLPSLCVALLSRHSAAQSQASTDYRAPRLPMPATAGAVVHHATGTDHFNASDLCRSLGVTDER